MNAPKLAAIVLMLCCGIGCGRQDDPASSPVHATGPTTTPATTRAAASASFLTIGSVTYEFPPARIRIARKDDTLFVQLYSQDPAGGAVDDNNVANGYYFDMSAEAPGNASLSSAPMLLTGPADERPESPNGISIEGSAKQLKPVDVRFDFDPPEGDRVTVHISGKFAVFIGPTSATPSEIVTVTATLTPQMDMVDTK
jgi:hypothetical protein